MQDAVALHWCRLRFESAFSIGFMKDILIAVTRRRVADLLAVLLDPVFVLP